MPEPALAVAGLTAGYQSGPAIVLDLSLDLAPGEIVALLGTNGAGKSTAIKAVAGAIRPRSGRVTCFGTQLAGLPPWSAARAGLAYVPQRQNVFEELSVRENLALGRRARNGRAGPDEDAVLALFPELAPHLARRAGMLSGGLRQMAAIGRALLGAPLVLLLDEPAAGLSGQATARLMAALAVLKQQVPILLVEQNIRAALAVADRACVMAGGQLRLTARPGDPAITDLLLGRPAA